MKQQLIFVSFVALLIILLLGCTMQAPQSAVDACKTKYASQIDNLNNCLRHVFAQYSDVNGCKTQLTDSPGHYYQSACLQEIAEFTLDTSICKGLTDNSYASDCYKRVAFNKRDSSICAEITKRNPADAETQDYCYFDLKDCNNIQNTSTKDTCISTPMPWLNK